MPFDPFRSNGNSLAGWPVLLEKRYYCVVVQLQLSCHTARAADLSASQGLALKVITGSMGCTVASIRGAWHNQPA
jgi:hypothetical protein